MGNYVIGIDGGGTKTRGVLFDESGKIIKEVIEGPSNIISNEAIAKLNIDKALQKLFENIEINQVSMIQLGLAGASRYPHHKAFIGDLKERYGVKNAALCSDIEMAIHAISNDHAVILAISGTGSSIMVKKQEEVFMIGGFGHLLGDEGSAYHLVMEAFKTVIDEHDRGLQQSTFTKQLLEAIDEKDVESIKVFVYGHDKSEIAQVSKIISKLAKENHKMAIRLLELEGRHLADQIIRAYNRLKDKDHVVIALKGGFIEQAPYVKDSMILRLNKSIKTYSIMDQTPDPILGAFYMAEKYQGGITK